MTAGGPLDLPPPRPEDRLPDPGEAADRRTLAVGMFLVLETVLLVALALAAWGGGNEMDTNFPKLTFEEGVAAIAAAGLAPTVLVAVGAAALHDGRGRASKAAAGILGSLGAVVGFLATALVALSRVEMEEH